MSTSDLPKYRRRGELGYKENINCLTQHINVVYALSQRGLSLNIKNPTALSGQDLLIIKASTGN